MHIAAKYVSYLLDLKKSIHLTSFPHSVSLYNFSSGAIYNNRTKKKKSCNDF